MAKPTLLDLVQDILTSMDSDEVNSWDDTVESTSVTRIVKQMFDEIVQHSDLPEQYQLFELDASGNSLLPVIMYRPEMIDTVVSLRYFDGTDWNTVRYLDPEVFLERSLALDTTQANVGTLTLNLPNGDIDIRYENDKAPQYWTSFDDNTLVFSSYDAAEDTTLVKAKTLCRGKVWSLFQFSNTFRFPLDQNQYSLLLNESKALCFAELKQAQHAKAEKKAREGWIRQQYTGKNLAPDKQLQYQGYGRK